MHFVFSIIVFFSIVYPCVAAVFKEDFQNAAPAVWNHADKPKSEIITDNGKTLLRVSGSENTILKIPCEPRKDFVMQVRVRGTGGIQFRERYKIFFKPDGDMWIRRPGSMLIDWVRTERDLKEFHTIKAVCIKNIVRFYVDETLELEVLDHAPISAPFYLCGSGDFDWIKIEDQVPDDEALMAVPKDAGTNFYEEQSYQRLKQPNGARVPDTALTFKAGEPVRIPVQIFNQAGDGTKRDLTLRISLADANGKALLPTQDQVISVAPGLPVEVGVDLGPVANGFHWLQLTLLRGNQVVRTVPYPVFVGVPQPPVEYHEPVFPFGVILQTVVWKPIHTKTYWHGIGSLLLANHLNTVSNINCHREFPETFELYGIATVERTENRLDYRTVIGLLPPFSDPQKILSAQNSTAKPVIASLPIEGIGDGTDSDPIKTWEICKPKIRMVRIHPFRQNQPDWLACNDKMTLPEALARINTGFDSPWWAMLQALGNKSANSELRNPTPAEISAETHIAIAYGAKGILYASLQDNSECAALVNYLSLRPLDDKLAAIAKLGAMIEKVSGQLKTLKSGSHQLKTDNKFVIAVPVMIADRPAAYLVNANTGEAVSCSLSWLDAPKEEIVTNIYDGEKMNTSSAGQLQIKLKAGEGKLLVCDGKTD